MRVFLFGAALFSLAVPVQAATMSFTTELDGFASVVAARGVGESAVTELTGNLISFDTSLGELTSVSLGVANSFEWRSTIIGSSVGLATTGQVSASSTVSLGSQVIAEDSVSRDIQCLLEGPFCLGGFREDAGSSNTVTFTPAEWDALLLETGGVLSAELEVSANLAIGMELRARAEADDLFAVVTYEFTEAVVAPVPLPAGGALLLGGIAALAGGRFKRKRNRNGASA